jgi:hypothetical protein
MKTIPGIDYRRVIEHYLSIVDPKKRKGFRSLKEITGAVEEYLGQSVKLESIKYDCELLKKTGKVEYKYIPHGHYFRKVSE